MSGGISATTVITMAMAAMSAIGTLASARAQEQAGAAQQQEANYVAQEQRTQAQQQQAASQRVAQQQDMQTQLVQSKVMAGAAASGATATDPSVVTNAATIAGQGRLKTLTDLYQGDSQAYALNNQANLQTYQGTLDRQAGQTQATGTLVSGASSLFSRYGSSFGGSSGDLPTIQYHDDNPTGTPGFG